jgi:hypothetical protein
MAIELQSPEWPAPKVISGPFWFILATRPWGETHHERFRESLGR